MMREFLTTLPLQYNFSWQVTRNIATMLFLEINNIGSAVAVLSVHIFTFSIFLLVLPNIFLSSDQFCSQIQSILQILKTPAADYFYHAFYFTHSFLKSQNICMIFQSDKMRTPVTVAVASVCLQNFHRKVNSKT